MLILVIVSKDPTKNLPNAGALGNGEYPFIALYSGLEW